MIDWAAGAGVIRAFRICFMQSFRQLAGYETQSGSETTLRRIEGFPGQPAILVNRPLENTSILRIFQTSRELLKFKEITNIELKNSNIILLSLNYEVKGVK
jgi:hypothetical protein